MILFLSFLKEEARKHEGTESEQVFVVRNPREISYQWVALHARFTPIEPALADTLFPLCERTKDSFRYPYPTGFT